METWVRLERHGPVGRIVLARGAAGNAINLEMAERLGDVAEACAEDPAIRAVTVEAEGQAFCVGGDLAAFSAQRGAARRQLLRRMAERVHAAQLRLLTMPKPVIVAAHGAVAGAGLGLALAGDIVLASATAHFTAAYTRVGLSADGGSTYLLPRLVGLRRTQELLLTNRRLSAAEALEWGLVTAVVAPPALAAAAAAKAHAMANGPTAAHGAIKRLLATSLQTDFAHQTALESRHISRLSVTADAAEGFAAFFEKRPPIFTGVDA